jgi:hypothetical protein
MAGTAKMADGAPPDPPGDLSSRKLPIHRINTGRKLFRVHKSAYGAKFFGRSGNWRFDDPMSSYGTLYAALTPYAAFAETLPRGTGTLVATPELAVRSLCSFTTVRTIRLAPLYGRHLAAVEANAAVTSGPYECSQQWSRALHERPDRPDGIAYRASHDNDELAVVIFERAAAAIDDGSSTELLADPRLLGEMLDHYRAALR